MTGRVRRQRENRETIERLNRDALEIARRFALRYRCIEAERANVKRRYGICYSDGTIRIRLRHATSGELLKYSSLVNTLCHELAHLRHFDHSPRFHRFYRELLAWAKRAQIYRPARTALVAPVVGAAAPLRAARDVPSLRDAWAAERARRAAIEPPPPAAASGSRGPEQLSLFG